MYKIAILAFLGLIVGLVVKKYTKEEFIQGRKYFVFLYKFFLLALLISSLFYGWYAGIFQPVLAFVAGMIVYMGISNLYLYLGGLFILSFWQRENFFNVVAVLTFVIGILRGFFVKKNVMNKIIISAIFFALPFLLIYVKESVLEMKYLLFAFISGAIFAEFLKKVDL
jgi:hypothetical protein